jgi:class 3 adenylate cyclase
MALFGAPVAHENDPERALRAALEQFSQGTWEVPRTLDLGLHFGINTGLVIAGGLGTSGRQEYSVMGDAVNVAARLEDVSERGEILVGPDTHRLTAPLFEFEALEPVQVKGKAEAVERGQSAARRTLTQLKTPHYGKHEVGVKPEAKFGLSVNGCEQASGFALRRGDR